MELWELNIILFRQVFSETFGFFDFFLWWHRCRCGFGVAGIVVVDEGLPFVVEKSDHALIGVSGLVAGFVVSCDDCDFSYIAEVVA